VSQPPTGVHIAAAEASEHDAILALFPSLASFDVPDRRNPRHLWEGDAVMLKDWAAGKRPDCFVLAARDDAANLLGAAMVSMREELLSHNPSAHLEAIVVAGSAQRMGVATMLLQAAENTARDRGARSMTLHVFASNQRARRLYEKAGYDGELIRYIKPFTGDALS